MLEPRPPDPLEGGAAWAEVAHQLLLAHRRSYDYEAARRARSPEVLRRPFETLETAFQVTSQVMVAFLVPKVHPFVPWLSRALRLRREYPQVLGAPSLAVLFSGLQAKFALDVANWWGLPPFRWVESRPAHDELLYPLGMHGWEFNVISAVVGVSLGRCLVALRHGLSYLADQVAGQLPLCVRACATPQVLCASSLTMCTLHVTAATVLAPLVVQELTALLREAQLRGRCLLPTVAQEAWGRCRQLLKCEGALAPGRREAAEEVAWWDGVDDADAVPHDLLCPITGQPFVRPVVLHGMVFESAAVQKWIKSTGRHPVLQGIWCHVGEIRPAPDVEALCHRLATTRGWVLSSPRR